MSDQDMQDAKAEAVRFLARVAAYEAHAKSKDGDHAGHYQCQHRSAMRRASLDLTRALAQMRRY